MFLVFWDESNSDPIQHLSKALNSAMHLIRFDSRKHLILLRLHVEAEVFDERIFRKRIHKVLLGERGECRVFLTVLTLLVCIHNTFGF